jgi:hypothetical protein
MALQQKTFTGFPYGLGAPGIQQMAMTNPLTLPQTSTKTIFTITGGPIMADLILGWVTTVIPAVANNTKLSFVDAITSTSTDLCLVSNISALAVGATYILVTSFGTAAAITSPGTVGVKDLSAVSRLSTLFTPGQVVLNCAGSDGGTGQIQWFMRYSALSVGLSQGGLVQITSPLI